MIKPLCHFFESALKTPLSARSRDASGIFEVHQKLGNKALFVFENKTSGMPTYSGVPRDRDTQEYLEQIRSLNPELLQNTLIAALDTSRPFETQWFNRRHRMQALSPQEQQFSFIPE
jgi:hypothetical protein